MKLMNKRSQFFLQIRICFIQGAEYAKNTVSSPCLKSYVKVSVTTRKLSMSLAKMSLNLTRTSLIFRGKQKLDVTEKLLIQYDMNASFLQIQVTLFDSESTCYSLLCVFFNLSMYDLFHILFFEYFSAQIRINFNTNAFVTSN